MTEEEFDRQVSTCLRAYAQTKRLPDDFADRLVGALRRRRWRRRAKLALLVASLAIAFLMVLGLCDGSHALKTPSANLVAVQSAEDGTTERISGFLFLGFIRDFVRRPRAMRKKEDENAKGEN